uniref:Uncharacterized protein n=1 Tax=Aegilops tauschii subsp. strangulata TaxID=200361 RepID=A0A453Q804_AEGTS
RMDNTYGHLTQATSKYLIHLPWLQGTHLYLFSKLFFGGEKVNHQKVPMMPQHTKRSLLLSAYSAQPAFDLLSIARRRESQVISFCCCLCEVFA